MASKPSLFILYLLRWFYQYPMGSHGSFRDLPARYGKDWAHCNISTCNHWVYCIFTHIFVKFAKVRQCWAWAKEKKTQQPTNDQTWYKWTRFGSSQNSEPRNHPKSNGLGHHHIWVSQKRIPKAQNSVSFSTVFPPDIHGFAPPVCTPASCLSDSEPSATNVPGMSCRHLKELSFPWGEKWWKTPSGMKGKPWLRMVHTG